MRRGAAFGVALTCFYVVLEATQFVYLGGLFQRIDPFLFGLIVFGGTAVGFTGWTWLVRPKEIAAARAHFKHVVLLNLCALVTFMSYLVSVQLIEPAITYSISSGMMPLSALVFAWFGVTKGGGLRNWSELAGTVVIFAGVVYLSIATLSGWSGFVRGGIWQGALGVATAMLDGVFFTLILALSGRLNAAGVGPAAVMGLRLLLYTVATGAVAAVTAQSMTPLPIWQLLGLCALGFVLAVPPLYVLQRAVALVSTFTIAVLTALGPIVIFGLQILEGRVAFATATLIGLSLYMAGALLTAFGGYRGR
ncbi:hypothetical protein AIOL_004718 [Candidatus Rhodobacter oscarellae]|uniref:EamA domain-containing protein n=1 Tax=Candidatus Rhodobacter oscarellae TaxID=1675527 RepID=A0A0J9EAC3_9RHOB|nr:hypothetical protein [Candidatus Rhodobacter lobularis]KMW59735.1 hypothetical protein AIOL_004718 [Candidatus Rhodobacter lobularis]